jgi:prevent-host-death family protein
MATTVNIHEAKTHFSRLIERVLGGERITIAKNGTPVAVLLPAGEAPPPQRVLGGDEGKVIIGKNFDDPLPEFEEYS